MWVNKVILLGFVGKDPEIRSTQSGKKIANISLATTEKWSDKQTGERKEETEWHRVVIFNEKLADVAEKYVRKGTHLYIEGKLKTRKWQDQQGNDRYSTEIVLSGYDGTLQMVSGNNQEGQEETQPKKKQASYAAAKGGWDTENNLDDEIPF